MTITIDHLRRFAVAHTLFKPTTLKRALDKLGFVQADPIRAPARAQDLTLRHRVKGYRAGDLQRRYSALGIEEDFFITYGFVTRALQSLMHPRSYPWTGNRRKKAQLLLEFILERGEGHPREVDRHFSHGKVTNYWGGLSNATTMLLDNMHYRGLLRVARREGGARIYAAHRHGPGPTTAADRRASIDALIDAAVHIYSPLPAASLSSLVSRLRYAVPQWRGELRNAVDRAKGRLSRARVDGADWYWSGQCAEINRALARPDNSPPEAVRLLAPFDPLVWDRARFELLWGWAYRFEAYTPAAKRKLGYYALPLLWRDRVIGWANLSAKKGGLEADIGYVESQPRDRTFRHELDAELDRIRTFLQSEP